MYYKVQEGLATKNSVIDPYFSTSDKKVVKHAKLYIILHAVKVFFFSCFCFSPVNLRYYSNAIGFMDKYLLCQKTYDICINKIDVVFCMLHMSYYGTPTDLTLCIITNCCRVFGC